ncbi:hypothetical protein niasHT_014822 [Heterodera trifolii]|uniref:RING-type domain-containing protein n=1 Tax=Heterodera trifolii TaxID=157864 RepID=A0ABD2L6L4_9BILA
MTVAEWVGFGCFGVFVSISTHSPYPISSNFHRRTTPATKMDSGSLSASLQAAEAEIGTLKEMLKLQNEKMKDMRHRFVNFRSRLDQLEAWASDNKQSQFVRPDTRKRVLLDDSPERLATSNAAASGGQCFHEEFFEVKLKKFMKEKLEEAKVCAEFALNAAERKMREQMDAQMQVERERNRKNLKAAMEEQNARCRRLALQSFRAAKEMVEKKMDSSILDNEGGVTPKWEQHCMFCLGSEAMFGRKECAHVNVCADCSIVWAGDDMCKCLTCQVPCQNFKYFGPSPQ